MKTARNSRSGNVFMVGADAMVVVKAEYNKSGHNAAVVKMKMKNRSPVPAPNGSTAPTTNSKSRHALEKKMTSTASPTRCLASSRTPTTTSSRSKPRR